ncbi:1876_t:CDS:1, partial [Racocetra persica]
EANTQDNKFFSLQSLEILDSSILIKQKNKAEKSKRDRPKIQICDDYSKGEDNDYKHYEVNCCYCNKKRWQHSKLLVMKAHLALYCKRSISDDIRKK